MVTPRRALAGVVLALMILGCGHMLRVPDWEIELWLVPGVYTHMRGDSLSIGYQCVVKDRVGDPPGSVALLEIEDPAGGVTSLGEEHFGVAWIPASTWTDEWGDDRVNWTRYPGYTLLERVETAQSGIYVWHLVDTDGNEVIIEDSLVASPVTWDVDEGDLFPPDSSAVGEDIVFHWPSAGTQYEFIFNLHNASDELVFSLDTADSLLIISDYDLNSATWYWWSLQVWDLRRDNCWESGGKRWFLTGE